MTVQRILRQEKLRPYKRGKTPRLSQHDKIRRLAFAKKYKSTKWKQVVFSDKHKFKFFSVVNQHNDIVWTNNPNQVPPRETLKYPPTWMAWAAITYEGETKLVEVKNLMNAKDYQVILQKKILSEINKMKGSSQ